VAELLCAIFYPAEVQEYFTMMLKWCTRCIIRFYNILKSKFESG
jgi:hypothetical protein